MNFEQAPKQMDPEAKKKARQEALDNDPDLKRLLLAINMPMGEDQKKALVAEFERKMAAKGL